MDTTVKHLTNNISDRLSVSALFAYINIGYRYLPKNPYRYTSIALYLSAPYIDRKDNPLKSWKMKKGQFPILSKLAKDYLAIPAMSTLSEWLFSAAAGYISNQRRSCLNVEHIH